MTGKDQAARTCRNAGDEPAHRKRPAPHPGPRCATCHRAERARAKKARHERMTQTVYGLDVGEYEALHDSQGGHCAICQTSTGAARHLAVDHDHACCPGRTSCGRCVRGLLCGPCNRMLGRFRDDPEALTRAARYLRHPPAQTVLIAGDTSPANTP